ncbi:MAG: proton-conducting transporter membrane subunit [Pseudohongiellaceae bacterium]|jgi:NAD(P)H-quinone oxidoreductase subunit 5
MSQKLLFEVLGGLVFIPTVLTFLWLSFMLLISRKPAEVHVVTLTRIAVACSLLGGLTMALILPLSGASHVSLGSWIMVDSHHYDFVILADMVSVSYAVFSSLLLYLICSFSQRYLHKEPGFHRFYLVLLLFSLGLHLVCFSGTLELLLVGWELVGLSSVLLIAFFTQRPQPALNGFWVFSVYRLTDIGLYAAVLVLHYSSAGTVFEPLEQASWAGIAMNDLAGVTSLLLLIAVIGKSALFPLCNWLPRAMEGPTPSSAVFYGALSVHLGPLLLLRMADIISNLLALQIALIVIGLLTVLIGNLVGRVQSDIKSRLAYGAVTQLGFIVAEIGLGWFELALVHVITHAVFRTLQFLRAPSLLHERHHLEQMLGHHISVFHPRSGSGTRAQRFMYRFSLERGFLDVVLADWIVNGTLSLFRRIDLGERRLASLISGVSIETACDLQDSSVNEDPAVFNQENSGVQK